LYGNSPVAGERIGQDFELFAVDSNLLRCGVPKLPDACTNFGGRETALSGNHWILVSGGKNNTLCPNQLFHAFRRSFAVIPVTELKIIY
jgi:hypothetical protein